MISIYDLKPKFQKLLAPILRVLNKFGVTANQITISSILFSALIGTTFWYAKFHVILLWFVPIGLLVRMALNALDGMMATTFNQQSKLGEILNELGDVVSDLFIYFPLLVHFNSSVYLIVLFLCLSTINEFAGLLTKVTYGKRTYEGPMGKSDRAFLISCTAIFLYFDILVIEYQVLIFSLANLLILLSTFNRLKAGNKHNG